MQITRNGPDTDAGPSDWFTGAVYIDAVAAPSGGSRLSASSVHFTPGARTAWHTHPNGQTIYVLEGVGLAPAARRADRGDPARRPRLLRAGRGALARRRADPVHDAPRDARGRRRRGSAPRGATTSPTRSTRRLPPSATEEDPDADPRQRRQLRPRRDRPDVRRRSRPTPAASTVLKHNRAPTPVEHQPVIRMNRDTLYSVAVVDISRGRDPDDPGRRGPLRLGDGRQPGPLHQPDPPRARRARADHRRVRHAVGRGRGAGARRSRRRRRRRRGQRAPGRVRGRGEVGEAVRAARLRHREPRRDAEGAARAGQRH